LDHADVGSKTVQNNGKHSPITEDLHIQNGCSENLISHSSVVVVCW